MSHWHDTMVDRPEADGAAYVTGWTISGLSVLAVILAAWGVRDLATTLERFTGGLLALVFARRCRAQGATDWNLRPPPSVVLRPQLAPHAGAVPFIATGR